MDHEPLTGPPHNKMGARPGRPQDEDDRKYNEPASRPAGAMAAGPWATSAFIIILCSVAGFWFLDPRPEEDICLGPLATMSDTRPEAGDQ